MKGLIPRFPYNMPAELLLIDALNLIRRIHAAVPAPDEQAQVDGAIAATRSSLKRALSHCQPSHALMVFDGDPPTWRHQLLPEYKADRKPMPQSLRKRLTDFNQAVRTMGIMTFRRNGVEADDVIAATALKAANAGIETTILSTDKAYQQLLVHPNIRIRDHFQKQDITPRDVESHYGIQITQLVDYWALAGVGDVPGVNGIGNKGAKQLIENYGSLEGILSRLEESTEGVKGALHQETRAKGPLAKVNQQQQRAELSKRLVTLKTEFDLGLSLRDMRYQPQKSLSDPAPISQQ